MKVAELVLLLQAMNQEATIALSTRFSCEKLEAVIAYDEIPDVVYLSDTPA